MTNAPGTKKKNAASTHKLMDDVPLWPAAAIHRGPSTVAILKSKTSQKPIALRNCPMGLALDSGAGVTRSRSSWIIRGAPFTCIVVGERLVLAAALMNNILNFDE